MTREEEVLIVLKAVVELEGNYEDNSWTNSQPDTLTCPICHESKDEIHRNEITMNDITHKQDCAYLIAKDLTTGL